MNSTKPFGTRSKLSGYFAGAAAIALTAPFLSLSTASAVLAPEAEMTSITAAGAFTQVVPDGVCSVNVTVAGAPGGLAIAAGDEEPDPDDPGEMRGANGAGAAVYSNLKVSAGQILTGTVGSNGGNSGAAGLPGGGEGGAGGHRGGGGGGYSELSFAGDLLILAGGGGATGGGHSDEVGFGGDAGWDVTAGTAVSGGTAYAGGDGTDGRDAGFLETVQTWPGAGTGGTATSGGIGGHNPISLTYPHDYDGFDGSALQGGNGGADDGLDTGGAGGGGWFGGGGGAATRGNVGYYPDYWGGAGGGGGSTFVSSSSLLKSSTLDMWKNRDDAGKALAGYVTFDWVMCEYDLGVTKKVVGNPVYEDGATVRYSVTVTNNGDSDMPVGDTVSIIDDLAVGGTLVSVDGLAQSAPAAGEVITAGIEAWDVVDLPAANPADPDVQRELGLAKGDSVTFVYDIIVSAPADGGPVVNTVSVEDRGGDPDNNVASAALDPAAPELDLVKEADTKKATEVGQKIKYTFVVTNVGNIEVRDVTVTEGEFSGTGELGDPRCPETVLQPGEQMTCKATYTVVKADLTGKDIVNTATASGATPMGALVESNEAVAAVDSVKPAKPVKPVKPEVLVESGGSPTGALGIMAALGAMVAGGLLFARRRKDSLES